MSTKNKIDFEDINIKAQISFGIVMIVVLLTLIAYLLIHH